MYFVGDLVRLNNGSVALVVSMKAPEHIVRVVQGTPPPHYHRYAEGIGVYPEYIKCRVEAEYTDELKPVSIDSCTARNLVGRAAVEFGLEVTATRIGPDAYELSFVNGDNCPATRYFVNADKAGEFLNSL